MSSYSTISIPKRVKQVLEKDKGDRDWGEYLLNLYEEAKAEKRARAFKKLRELLSEDDLKRILEESRLLRRGFGSQMNLLDTSVLVDWLRKGVMAKG
ncbi:MAG: hypothetical protein LZ171_04895 [Thaumarchaeota archaeon]|jgi:hypothetical protein|nr:hypothetical protein [Candidatus Geocrenenecus arthurdayi]